MAKYTKPQREQLLRQLNKSITKESAEAFKLNKNSCLEVLRKTLPYSHFSEDGNEISSTITPWRASYIIYNELDELDDGVQIRRKCGNNKCIHPKHLREVNTIGTDTGFASSIYDELKSEVVEESGEYMAQISLTLLRGLVASGFGADLVEIWPASGLEDWEYLLSQEEVSDLDEYQKQIRSEDPMLGADFATRSTQELINNYFAEFLLELDEGLRKQTQALIEETLEKRELNG